MLPQEANLNEDTRLVVRVGGEGLGLLGRDGRVALDQWRHHTSGSFDAKGQRGHVKKKKILKSILSYLYIGGADKLC